MSFYVTSVQDNKLLQTVEVYTYNRSIVEILDDSNGDRSPSSSIKTKYNWNDKQENWEDNEESYEDIEILCYAAGGRPLPRFQVSSKNYAIPAQGGLEGGRYTDEKIIEFTSH